MPLNYRKIGDLITKVSEKNKDGLYDEVLGVAIEKEFMPSVANTIGTDLKKYNVIRKNRFAFNPMHVGRDEKLPIAVYHNDEPALVSPAYFMFEVIDRDVDINYLMLVFKTASFDHLCWFHTDASVRGGLTWDDFADIEVNIPSLEEQQTIVRQYKTITDRICVLERINEELNKQADCIFKEEIINSLEEFDEEPLDKNIDFVNGLAMQRFRPKKNEKGIPVIKIRELSQGYCDGNSEYCRISIDESHLINNGDLVFSWSGSLKVDFWSGGLAGLNQHLFKVTSKRFYDWFSYLWVNHYLIDFQTTAKNKGTTFGHIKREDLTASMIKVPNNEQMKILDKKMKPIFDLIKINSLELQQLRKLKAIVLP